MATWPRRHDPLPGGARASSSEQALGGLDLVVDALDRALEARRAPGRRAGRDRHRRRRPHRRPLPRGPPGDPVAARAAGAGGRRPALVAALLHVIKHVERMGDQCVNIAKLIPLDGPRAARPTPSMLERDRADGPAARAEVGPGQAGVRASATSTLAAGPRAPGRRDRPAQPRGLPAARWRSATTPTGASGRCT